MIVITMTDERKGYLGLFDSKRDGEPNEIVKQLPPTWNSISFFATTVNSFHQVNEVLTARGRLSISGWLYGDPLERPEPLTLPPIQLLDPIVSP